MASVYLDVRGDDARLDEQLVARWRNAERSLRAQDATPASIDAIRDVVEDVDPSAGDTLAVFADAHGLRLRRSLPDPPARGVTRVDSLVYAAPLAEWAQSQVAHLVVLIDRVGADIVAFAGPDPLGSQELMGDTLHVHRGHPGGWSQRRFQQRAENTWERNARDVADEVGRLNRSLDAAAIIVAGDVRARSFFLQHLPDDARARVHQFDGARGTDDPLGEIAEETVRTVATIVASRTRMVMERFVEERGRGGLAADGAQATLSALGLGGVDTLLVHDDPDDDRRAWFGPEPKDVATSRAAIEALGRPAQSGRLTDVALRAALLTGAGVRIVPGSGPNAPSDGVGAILRFPVEGSGSEAPR